MLAIKVTSYDDVIEGAEGMKQILLFRGEDSRRGHLYRATMISGPGEETEIESVSMRPGEWNIEFTSVKAWSFLRQMARPRARKFTRRFTMMLKRVIEGGSGVGV